MGAIVYPRIDTIYGPLVPYSENVRQLCYEIWAFQAGRQAKETEAMLHALLTDNPDLIGDYELNNATEIKDGLIRQWATKHKWDERANGELGRLMPNIRSSIHRELTLMSFVALGEVRKILNGTTQDDAKIQSIKLKASFGTFDRAGYAPRNAPVLSDDPGTGDFAEIDLKTVPMDQLAVIEEDLKARHAKS